MPIYEYECGTCCLRFEVKQGFNEAPEAMCPQCQGRVRRVFHSTPVIFRGSGFYVTDTRKSPEPEAAPKPEPKGTTGK
ncbi:MAG: zinc ribbon domain-containing protein [Chloroflexi bacterium]|nr:zinc ribbon domain-containing protein [Chloroflexota bacterium]